MAPSLRRHTDDTRELCAVRRCSWFSSRRDPAGITPRRPSIAALLAPNLTLPVFAQPGVQRRFAGAVYTTSNATGGVDRLLQGRCRSWRSTGGMGRDSGRARRRMRSSIGPVEVVDLSHRAIGCDGSASDSERQSRGAADALAAISSAKPSPPLPRPCPEWRPRVPAPADAAHPPPAPWRSRDAHPRAVRS